MLRPSEYWYKTAIIYSLDLETFMDSNGDGVGDFRGLGDRLDYLAALGVDTLWLAPFQKTPNRDNGYDISDYYAVDGRHGDGGDFVEFMHQARERGLRVIIDAVLNHVSDQHRWFQEARADPDSRFRDWFIWSKRRPADWRSGIVFPGYQKSTWTRDAKAGAYYYHRFYRFQPDLNMDNPAVRDEVLRVLGFWLELGVRGFRMDAVPFLIETTVPGKAQGDEHFEYLAEIREFLQRRYAEVILLGEANVLPKQTRPYFRSRAGDGLNLMFNFFVNQHLFLALATGEVEPLKKALRATRDIPGAAQWAHFLRNHDELDLGRLDDEQRERVMARFAPNKNMRLYGRGIRRRLASMLGDRAHLELAYSVLFALPGTPVLRYGDELGMGDDLSLEQRNSVRTPMQWSGERNGGFSTAEKTVLPVIEEGIRGAGRVNVLAQRTDPESLLNWTIDMIRLRRECPEVGLGAWKLLTVRRHPGALAMRYDWSDRTLLTLHNFQDSPCEAPLRPGDGIDGPLLDLRTGERIAARKSGAYTVPLDAWGYRWLRPANRGI